jgi:hypothetical protein
MQACKAATTCLEIFLKALRLLWLLLLLLLLLLRWAAASARRRFSTDCSAGRPAFFAHDTRWERGHITNRVRL